MEEAEADFLAEPCCDAYETHDGLMVATVSTFKAADLKFKTAASSALTHGFHYASGPFSTRPARTTAVPAAPHRNKIYYGSASTECESIADPGTLGARAIAGYQRRDRFFAPLVRIVLSRLLGWRYDGLEPARQLVAELLTAEIMLPFARAVAGYWIDLSGLRMGGKRPRRRKCTHEQKDTSEHGEIDRELHGGRAVAIPDQGMKSATENAGVGQDQ